ncbi:MAG: DUF4367 domain-containing protein [Butyrivibrio sp.]|nr:DUF4367 domain-containing protein [Butyrivibrio sp.]
MANANIVITDEWLYQTMPLIDQVLLQKIENEVDYEYEFSEHFKRRMRKLISRERRLRFWYGLSGRTRRIAAIAGILTASLLVSTLSVQAYRSHFFETVKTALEDSALYTYLVGENGEGEISEQKFEAIIPKTIPQGYEIVEETKGELRYSLLYENERKEILDWNQEKVTDTLSLVIDTEYEWEKIVKKNGRDVTIHGYSDGYKVVYYEYEVYIFTIYADNVEISDILAMLPD